MSTPILATKLHIPSPRPQVILRPRLIERLNGGLRRKMTLLSAPAGFGKTTLVCEWIAECPRPVAWLSLDEGDNEPARFLAYLVAALQTVAPTLGEGVLGALQSPQPPPTESILTALLNEIAAIPDHFVLVLDDYHVIESLKVDTALVFILDHFPPQMHLVIASRMDPSLPLSRLRVGGQMIEIREGDLRFTLDETAAFLDTATGLNLSPENVAALKSRTEGWVAGLQLAVLSIQGLDRSSDVTDFINRFTGSDRYIHDYLADEVLQQRPEGTKDFLLQTSILNRLCGPLCDAVTKRENSQSILEALDAANLFIIPLDNERHWYRYHHLFADLLHQRLRQTLREQEPTFHRRAGEWYERNGFADEAIEHAFRAEDFERAAKQIEGVAEAVWASGVDTKLRRWLARLPAELLFSKPPLCIFHAWYLLAGGNQGAAERVIQVVELALETSRGETIDHAPHAWEQRLGSDDSTLRGRAATIQAFAAFYRGDVPGIIQHTRQALKTLPAQDWAWRSTANHLLGDAYDFNGEMEKAYRSRLETVQASNTSAHTLQSVIANLKLAIILRHQGRLSRVTEICQQQLVLANDSGMAQTVVVGWLLAIWGEVLAELNDLDEAIDRANKGVELTERGGDLAMLGWSYLCLIRTLFSSGDIAGADEIVHKIENLAQDSFVPPWILNLNAAWQARLWLAQGKLETASRWVEERGLDADREPTYVHELEYLVFVRVLNAQGQLGQATTLLQRQLKAAEAGGRTSRRIEILMLQALAFQAGGDTAQAMTAIEQALILAEPGGFVRIFVDEGPPMASLLYAAIMLGITPDYTRRLLASFPDGEPNKRGPSETQPPQSELVEPLSQRELEVLELIAQGLSNREISERLFVTLNTVKGHNRNIYGKLQVQRRTKAVARARALGLL